VGKVKALYGAVLLYVGLEERKKGEGGREEVGIVVIRKVFKRRHA